MSDLNEAMAAMRKGMGNVRNWDGEQFGAILTRDELIDLATAALAALRETHHLVPKDQEPNAWVKPNWQDPANYDGTSPVTVYPRADWTPLYALEKRHD